MKPKEYKISTLKDIYEIGNVDTIQRCMSELTEMIVQAVLINKLALSAAESAGIEVKDGNAIGFPDSCKWIDDGKNDGSFIIKSPENGGVIGSIEIKQEKDSK